MQDESESGSFYARLSNYDEFVVGGKRIFAATLLQFDVNIATVDHWKLSYFIGVGAVATFWILFGGIMLRYALSFDCFYPCDQHLFVVISNSCDSL
eukprot:SAG31_NODE_4995_length_2814_cov_1.128545_5_plen_96_part_00